MTSRWGERKGQMAASPSATSGILAKKWREVRGERKKFPSPIVARRKWSKEI